MNSNADPAPHQHSAQGDAPLDVDRFPYDFAEPPREGPGALEGTLCRLNDGSILFSCYDAMVEGDVSTHYASCMFRRSSDEGRTWSDPWYMTDADGSREECFHMTLLRLPSGRLGIVYSTRKVPQGRTGRDGGTVFRHSDNEGKTWSDPVVLEPRFGICCSGHAIVTSTDRLVVPVF